jgi:hypothetical protein
MASDVPEFVETIRMQKRQDPIGISEPHLPHLLEPPR